MVSKWYRKATKHQQNTKKTNRAPGDTWQRAHSALYKITKHAQNGANRKGSFKRACKQQLSMFARLANTAYNVCKAPNSKATATNSNEQQRTATKQ